MTQSHNLYKSKSILKCIIPSLGQASSCKKININGISESRCDMVCIPRRSYSRRQQHDTTQLEKYIFQNEDAKFQVCGGKKMKPWQAIKMFQETDNKKTKSWKDIKMFQETDNKKMKP